MTSRAIETEVVIETNGHAVAILDADQPIVWRVDPELRNVTIRIREKPGPCHGRYTVGAGYLTCFLETGHRGPHSFRWTDDATGAHQG